MKKITLFTVLLFLSLTAFSQTSKGQIAMRGDLIQRSPINATLEGTQLKVSYGHLKQPVTLRLHNAIGRIAYSKENIAKVETVDMATAPRGVYIVAVCGSGGNCHTSKISLKN